MGIIVGLGSDFEMVTILKVAVVFEHVIVVCFVLLFPCMTYLSKTQKKQIKREAYIREQLKDIDDKTRLEYCDWRNWSRKQFENYLKVDGITRHKLTIQRLSDIDGEALLSMPH